MAAPLLDYSSGVSDGYREELGRVVRVNFYLRVLFSLLLLVFAGFGPGLLMRFPFTGPGVTLGPLSQFYAFRAVIFALLFVALACVLAALCRRAIDLFAAKLAVDLNPSGSPEEWALYFRHLRPSAFPFVLSGSSTIDVLVFLVTIATYVFWVVVMVETTPVVMSGYQVAGIVLGSYGLFASLIVVTLVWRDSGRRIAGLVGPRPATSAETPETDKA